MVRASIPPGGHPGTPADLASEFTLPSRWSADWQARPDRPVLVMADRPDRRLDGAALHAQTTAVVAALADRAVAPGDRVLWCGTPDLAPIVALLGALRLGAVVVPVSPAFTAEELAYVVGDARPTLAIVGDQAQRGTLTTAVPALTVCAPDELLAQGIAPTATRPLLDAAQPTDDALIVYTSGTTGRPKGAVHTHASLAAGVHALRLAWQWEPEDRLLLALPLFHVHGLVAGLFGTLTAGATARIIERFTEAAVLEAAPSCSMFFGVPTMYHRLEQTGRAAELSGLRLCVSGSAPLSADLWHRMATEGVSVLERYGMSETLLTLSNPVDGQRKPGTVGTPLPGVEASIADPDQTGVGQLLVRGPSLCRGYWERPDASADAWVDGWFATGDLASVDDDGYVTLRGRTTELIITGGHNVYPTEVEAVLARHASVAELAVVGVASAEWGESVEAFVVGVDGAPDLHALAALAEQHLAPYKRPRHFHVVDALPRNAMGKVLRRELSG